MTGLPDDRKLRRRLTVWYIYSIVWYLFRLYSCTWQGFSLVNRGLSFIKRHPYFTYSYILACTNIMKIHFATLWKQLHVRHSVMLLCKSDTEIKQLWILHSFQYLIWNLIREWQNINSAPSIRRAGVISNLTAFFNKTEHLDYQYATN